MLKMINWRVSLYVKYDIVRYILPELNSTVTTITPEFVKDCLCKAKYYKLHHLNLKDSSNFFTLSELILIKMKSSQLYLSLLQSLLRVFPFV
jgi:hypothetical protein